MRSATCASNVQGVGDTIYNRYEASKAGSNTWGARIQGEQAGDVPLVPQPDCQRPDIFLAETVMGFWKFGKTSYKQAMITISK